MCHLSSCQCVPCKAKWHNTGMLFQKSKRYFFKNILLDALKSLIITYSKFSTNISVHLGGLQTYCSAVWKKKWVASQFFFQGKKTKESFSSGWGGGKVREIWVKSRFRSSSGSELPPNCCKKWCIFFSPRIFLVDFFLEKKKNEIRSVIF